MSRTLHRTWTRMKTNIRRAWSEPWMRAMLYIAGVPLFPEYIAPVLAILAFFAAFKDAQVHKTVLSIGSVGKILLLYIAYMAFGVIFAKLRLASAAAVALWGFLFLAYLTLTNVLTDRKRLDTALYAVTIVAGVVGLIGCIQYFLRFIGISAPLQFWNPLDRLVYSLFPLDINLHVNGVRVSSTFNNPNILGQYLVLTTPLAVHYALHCKKHTRRTLARFSLVAIIGCAAFTFSRGTYLSLLMVALVLVIANVRSILTILLSALSALLLTPDAVWNRLMSVGKLDTSSMERLSVWEWCIGLIAKNPLFGSGCGVEYTWQVMQANGIFAPHAHNLVLQLLIEGGIFGFCIVLFLGFRVVQSAFTLLNRRESRSFGVTLLALVVGFCTNGMVEYGLTFPKVMSAFAVMLAVTDVVCNLYLNRKLSPLKETVTVGRRLLGKLGVTAHK